MQDYATETLGGAAVIYVAGVYLRRRLRTWLADSIPEQLLADDGSSTPAEVAELVWRWRSTYSWVQFPTFLACMLVWQVAFGFAFDQYVLSCEPWVVFPSTSSLAGAGVVVSIYGYQLVHLCLIDGVFARAVRDRASRLSRPVPHDRFKSLARWKSLLIVHGFCAMAAALTTPSVFAFNATGLLGYHAYKPWPSVRSFDSIETICVAERGEISSGRQKVNQRVEDGWAVGFRFADGSYWSSLGYKDWVDYDEATLRRAVERVSQLSGRPITPVDIVWRQESPAKNRWRKRNGFEPNACSDASARTNRLE